MYRVVIVEDDPMISQLNYQYIQKEPDFHVVNRCKTGKEALQWLKKYQADLLILDVYMPIMSGLELLHTLRTMDSPIDVIMVTAANDPETVDTLFKLGAIDYLVKPFTYERFHMALEQFLRRKKMLNCATVQQSALDQIFSTPHSAPPPKGLQENTLHKIRTCLSAATAQQGFPSETLASETGLSVVTIRRYMNYLVECGEVASTIKYDTGGRPCRVYHLLS